MALPPRGTLTGDLGNALGGSPSGAGTLWLTPPTVVAYADQGYTLLPQPIAVPVAADGTLTATAVARTDLGNPSGWAYVARADVPGLPETPFAVTVVSSSQDIAAGIVSKPGYPEWLPTTTPHAHDGLYPSRAEVTSLINGVTGVDVSGVLCSLGVVATGTDCNTLTTQGIWSVTGNSLLESLVNGPVAQGDLDAPRPGSLLVLRTSNGILTQTLHSYAGGGVYYRASANLAGTSWGRWRQAENGQVMGVVPAGGNALTYTGGAYRGDWLVTEERAASIVNLPEPVPGVLQVLSPSSQLALLVFRSVETSGSRVWVNTRVGSGAWSGWQLEGGGSGGGSDAPRLIADEAARRRGGRIGTNGRGAINLRYDHNAEDFKTKVLPLLVARGLPCTLAMPADVLDGDYAADPPTTVTWAEVQEWALQHGVEMAWHSKTHGPADTPSAWESEIVGGYTKLRAALPLVKIDVGIQIGTTGSMWGGLLPIDSPAKLHGTPAGRLMLETIPIVNGHSGGYFRPLTGQIGQGLAHETIESTDSYPDAASIIALMTEARDTASGLSVMIHPNQLDKAGRITTATLTTVLDWLAAERDAGRIDVLTYGGLSVADESTDYRHTLIRNGSMSTLAEWTHTGWTVAGGWAVSPATTAEAYQDTRFTRRQGLTGVPRELVAEVSADTAATVRLRVRDTTSYSTLDASRDVAIPAGQTRTVRLPFTIPYSPTGYPTMWLRSSLARVSGGQVKVRHVRLTST